MEIMLPAPIRRGVMFKVHLVVSQAVELAMDKDLLYLEVELTTANQAKQVNQVNQVNLDIPEPTNLAEVLEFQELLRFLAHLPCKEAAPPTDKDKGHQPAHLTTLEHTVPQVFQGPDNLPQEKVAATIQDTSPDEFNQSLCYQSYK